MRGRKKPYRHLSGGESESSVYSLQAKCPRIEAFASTLPHFLISLFGQVRENLLKIAITRNAPTVFRRTHLLSIQA